MPWKVSEHLYSESFFIEENEENKVDSNVAWSIVGGANKDYVRKEEEKKEEQNLAELNKKMRELEEERERLNRELEEEKEQEKEEQQQEQEKERTR